MKIERSAGVLLHPTCLPSPFGIGDVGPSAERYLGWLAAAGVRWWQVLPLNPPGSGWSPYSALSTFAGDPMLISPERMVEDGLLEPDDLEQGPGFPDTWIDFEAVVPYKEGLLRTAFERVRDGGRPDVEADLAMFRDQEDTWLPAWSVFAALRRAHGGAPWWRWPDGLDTADQSVLDAWMAENAEAVRFEVFCQWLFDRQWRRLRERAGALGVRLLGDVPIFVAGDSAEVWAERALFRVDEKGHPDAVAGVPPDAFSDDGQLWGNPLYDWERHAATGYRWWARRMGRALELVDALRLDHFRGFAAFWEVPADAETAAEGRWVPGPGRALFDGIRDQLGAAPFVAEDLGTITPDVHELRREVGLPGMAVLQFAFTPRPRSIYLPYNLEHDTVIYTGTHDNTTTVGWWREEATEGERDLARRYMGTDGSEIHWGMIRLALGSVADLAVMPHQDLAGLGSDCRMNTPGVAEGNWRFRVTPPMLDDWIRHRLARLIETYGR